MNTTTNAAGETIPAIGAPGSIARKAAVAADYVIGHDEIVKAAADQALKSIYHFLSADQIRTLRGLLKGEEAPWFRRMLWEYAGRIEAMPRPYGQDGKGDQAVVFLHYFKGGADWWITERDSSQEQLQAFGLADLGHGAEMGYISIAEIISYGVELDLHFKPVTIADLKAAGRLRLM